MMSWQAKALVVQSFRCRSHSQLRQRCNHRVQSRYRAGTWRAVKKGQEFNTDELFRANMYKHSATRFGSWRYRSHHLAFVPIRLTPTMPSGDKFSRTLITINLEQVPTFYLLKVVVVVAPLTLTGIGLFIASPFDDVCHNCNNGD